MNVEPRKNGEVALACLPLNRAKLNFEQRQPIFIDRGAPSNFLRHNQFQDRPPTGPD
jgi:hypothetical protein